MPREMKESGIGWVGCIPTTWKVLPNKYLMHKLKYVKPMYEGEDILSLTMNGVVVRDLDAGGKMPTSFDGYQTIYPGNLLMCLFDYDVTPRCIGYINDAGVTSPAYSQFVLHANADAKYYFYYYLMLDFTKELLHLAKNLRHSFTEEQLGAIKAPVPPLFEQKHIANFLDIKCDEIDALSADIQKQIEKLEEYKKAIITEAVTKGLDPNVEMKDSGIEYIGKYPSAWNLKRLKYILKERNERTLTGEEELLSVSQYKGVIPSKETSNRTMQAESLIGYKKVYVDDLVFNKLNPGLARFGWSAYDGITSPDFAVYIVNKICHAKFLQAVLKSDKYVTKIKSLANGVGEGFVRLYSPQLYEFIVAVPEKKDELEHIISYIEHKSKVIDEIIQKKNAQRKVLEEYKKSIIYEYVTGKKEVPVIE